MLRQGCGLTLMLQRTGHCTWQWAEARAEAHRPLQPHGWASLRESPALGQGGVCSSPSGMISLVNTGILEVSREDYG